MAEKNKNAGAISFSGWSLSDLKAVSNEALELKANALLNQVRALAERFKGADLERALCDFCGSEDNLRLFLFKTNPATHLIRYAPTFVRLRGPQLRILPKLPSGYGYKGGAARLALGVALGEALGARRPRDLDIVRIGAGAISQDKKIAARFSGEDFEHGHGVEVVESLESYFSSRDIIINEVLLVGGELICTKRALKDAVDGVIRPTEFALGAEKRVAALVALKLVRFWAEAEAQKRSARLGEFEAERPSKFEYDLQHKRALQSSAEAASLFVSECQRRDLLPAAKG